MPPHQRISRLVAFLFIGHLVHESEAHGQTFSVPLMLASSIEIQNPPPPVSESNKSSCDVNKMTARKCRKLLKEFNELSEEHKRYFQECRTKCQKDSSAPAGRHFTPKLGLDPRY